MRSITSPMPSVVTLLLTIGFSSCASLAAVSPPKLELRTLRLSREVPGFEYQYDVCVKKFFGICTGTAPQKDVYDLTKPEVREMLINMGFVGKVREKPLQ